MALLWAPARRPLNLSSVPMAGPHTGALPAERPELTLHVRGHFAGGFAEAEGQAQEARRAPLGAGPGQRTGRQRQRVGVVVVASDGVVEEKVRKFILPPRPLLDLGYSNPTEFIKEAIYRYLNELKSAEKLSFQEEPEP